MDGHTQKTETRLECPDPAMVHGSLPPGTDFHAALLAPSLPLPANLPRASALPQDSGNRESSDHATFSWECRLDGAGKQIAALVFAGERSICLELFQEPKYIISTFCLCVMRQEKFLPHNFKQKKI